VAGGRNPLVAAGVFMILALAAQFAQPVILAAIWDVPWYSLLTVWSIVSLVASATFAVLAFALGRSRLRVLFAIPIGLAALALGVPIALSGFSYGDYLAVALLEWLNPLVLVGLAITVGLGGAAKRVFACLAAALAVLGAIVQLFLVVFSEYAFWDGYWLYLAVMCLAPIQMVLAGLAYIWVAFAPLPGEQPAHAAAAPRPGAPPGAPYGYRPVAVGTNGMAVASLVFGIIGGSVLAIIFGHVARSQVKRTGQEGGGMALAGLILGYIWLVINILATLFMFGLAAWFRSAL
jgi:hypothetical protein